MIELGFSLIGCVSFVFASVVFIGMIIQQPWLLIPFLLVWFAWAAHGGSADSAKDQHPPSG